MPSLATGRIRSLLPSVGAVALALLLTAAAAHALQPPKAGAASASDKAAAAATPGGSAASPSAGNAPAAGSARGAASAKILELDWEELLPKETRLKFQSAPPAPVHDYLGEGGMAAQQVLDFSVNKELDGAQVKLPGFIVPLDIGKDGLVSEFFLVPYFGACIHVPPPPPNQIVYVKMGKGIALESIYEAYWITGRLKVTNKTTRLGAAAYQIDASKVEIYKY